VRILIVDDSVHRHHDLQRILRGHEICSAFDVRGAKDLIERCTFDMAFLDHDLNSLSESGKDVARILTELPDGARPHQIVIHSWNPSGALSMESILRTAGFKRIAVMPFNVETLASAYGSM